MQISKVSAYRVRIPFRATFSHALQSRSLTDTIVLVIESDVSDIGIGEVLPRPYVTGETVESVLEKEIPAFARRWFQHTFEDRDEVIEALRQEAQIAGRALATLAGWELAVLDMAGKAFHFPAGDVLGPAIGPELEGGAVVDFSVPTQLLEKHCMLLRLANQRYIKVKVGLDDDLRRLELARGTLGADQALRLDANGAWSSDFA